MTHAKQIVAIVSADFGLGCFGKINIKLKLTGDISFSDIKIKTFFCIVVSRLSACLFLKMTSFGEEEDSNMVSSSGSSPALGNNEQDPEVLEVLSTSPNSSSSR